MEFLQRWAGELLMVDCVDDIDGQGYVVCMTQCDICMPGRRQGDDRETTMNTYKNPGCATQSANKSDLKESWCLAKWSQLSSPLPRMTI